MEQTNDKEIEKTPCGCAGGTCDCDGNTPPNENCGCS